MIDQNDVIASGVMWQREQFCLDLVQDLFSVGNGLRFGLRHIAYLDKKTVRTAIIPASRKIV